MLFSNLGWDCLSKSFVMSKIITTNDFPVLRATVIVQAASRASSTRFFTKEAMLSKVYAFTCQNVGCRIIIIQTFHDLGG